jgi:hypothetical protein
MFESGCLLRWTEEGFASGQPHFLLLSLEVHPLVSLPRGRAPWRGGNRLRVDLCRSTTLGLWSWPCATRTSLHADERRVAGMSLPIPDGSDRVGPDQWGVKKNIDSGVVVLYRTGQVTYEQQDLPQPYASPYAAVPQPCCMVTVLRPSFLLTLDLHGQYLLLHSQEIFRCLAAWLMLLRLDSIAEVPRPSCLERSHWTTSSYLRRHGARSR